MDDELPLPPAASALRESFGDRKLPDISRKITACVACRKQKVKISYLSMYAVGADIVVDGRLNVTCEALNRLALAASREDCHVQ
jgi:hypothetical protein